MLLSFVLPSAVRIFPVAFSYSRSRDRNAPILLHVFVMDNLRIRLITEISKICFFILPTIILYSIILTLGEFMLATAGRIRHENELEKYAPPGHHGTVNVRLVERDFCGTFEMALGILEPGGTAERHDHDVEHQVIYVLEGLCDVELGDQPAVECGPGTIIEIPPKVMHFVVSKGETPLKVLVLYSPPLPPRDDTPVD